MWAIVCIRTHLLMQAVLSFTRTGIRTEWGRMHSNPDSNDQHACMWVRSLTLTKRSSSCHSNTTCHMIQETMPAIERLSN
jgi:hypothetical protein